MSMSCGSSFGTTVGTRKVLFRFQQRAHLRVSSWHHHGFQLHRFDVNSRKDSCANVVWSGGATMFLRSARTTLASSIIGILEVVS